MVVSGEVDSIWRSERVYIGGADVGLRCHSAKREARLDGASHRKVIETEKCQLR